ncbi:DHA2 family efflux MFS transporter permease subunit [Streptomyces sp. NPDC059070]|uniref:DHA2 family efflux MFS transporter permease subunit n=1 Tax=Streptomyces sp. NPDC059070 TaxID=3346713 RepID=UPI0036CD0D02
MEPNDGRAAWTRLGILCVSFFMIVLDTTIVHVAIPAMTTGLTARLDTVLWIVNVYVLTYAVFMIPAGRLGARYGPKPVHLAGLALFTAASALCGCASGAGELLLWRGVQGVGAALITPQIGAFITTLFPAHRRGAAFGTLTSVMGLSIVVGPLLGGVLVTSVGWQWIFVVNVPAGAVALVLSALLLPSPRPGGERGVDLPGLALVTAGLTAVTVALLGRGRPLPGPAGSLTHAQVLCAGAACLVLFAVQQRSRSRAPLVPRALFARRDFALANLVGAGIHFAVIGTAAPLALFVQRALDRSALQAGLLTAPTPLAAAAAAHVAGRLADRTGGRPLVLAGVSTYAYGLVLIGAQAHPGTNPWHLLPAMLLADLGIGCALAPLTRIAMASVEARHAGAASGVLNTSRQVGGVLGTACAGALVTDRTASAAGPLGYAEALHATTLLTAGVLGACLVLACALRPDGVRRGRPGAVLLLDALPVVVREGPHFAAAQILTAVRVGRRGRREVVAFALAGTDPVADWSPFLRRVRTRGLSSVRQAVCADTPGLAAAVDAVLGVPVRVAAPARHATGQLRRTLLARIGALPPGELTAALLAETVHTAVGAQNARWARRPRRWYARLPGTSRKDERKAQEMKPPGH